MIVAAAHSFQIAHPEILLLVVALVGLFVFLLAALVGLWLLLGRGPRRARAYRRAQRLLHQGDWQGALTLVQGLQQGGRLSPLWTGRLRNAEGEAEHAAGDEALRERRYEESLEHYRHAAELLNLDVSTLQARVVEVMLAEARRLFAAASDKDLAAAQKLLVRTRQVQLPCAEAAFWQGMCSLVQRQPEAAQAAFVTAHEEGQQRYLDPPLYLGAFLLRQGRPQEALRYLAEANRTDNSCPLVPWQLGLAIVAVGGDSRVAVQALQRATGPRGLGVWAQERGPQTPDQAARNAQRFWVEVLPETRSFVRRLALKHPFTDPLFGNDVAAMVRQGQFALAQAYYRLGNFQESADLFTKLLGESPPSVPLLRGLGLALARLQRYDQAFKHLRAALEGEEPRDPLTAGYLALCGAMGKPSQAEDRPRNVAWAIRQLARFPLPGNAEWAGLASTIFAEARSLGLPLALEDQLRLCEALAAVDATDPLAAAAYDHLAATYPDALRPEFAWLYCRAVQLHNCSGGRDLDLFALTFRSEEAARAFFTQRGWDFDELEYTYLARTAAGRPGAFPKELGADYPSRGEARLLARSQAQEAAGQKEAALATADVLLRLAPRSAAAHDRLAFLHYHRAEFERAAALLSGWSRLEPTNHWPLCRLAVVEHQQGHADTRRQAIRQALNLTQGATRAEIAFLGARLALSAGLGAPTPEKDGQDAAGSPDLAEADRLLRQCLQDNPEHVNALWQLAALRSLRGEEQALAAQTTAMQRPGVKDARFHYLAAVCHLAAGDYPRVLAFAQRAAQEPALSAESHYLMGWAQARQNDNVAAVASLQKVIATPGAVSADHARALLGRLHFERGAYEEAIACWNALPAQRRRDWQLEDTLRSTVYLAGLQAYRAGKFEEASNQFREAGRLGLRERRLGSLLALALFRAGKRLLFGNQA